MEGLLRPGKASRGLFCGRCSLGCFVRASSPRHPPTRSAFAACPGPGERPSGTAGSARASCARASGEAVTLYSWPREASGRNVLLVSLGSGDAPSSPPPAFLSPLDHRPDRCCWALWLQETGMDWFSQQFYLPAISEAPC